MAHYYLNLIALPKPSPAFLSLSFITRPCFNIHRCGMIYMETAKLGWRPLMASYLSSLPESITEEQKGLLTDLFEWLVPGCIKVRGRHREGLELATKTSFTTKQLYYLPRDDYFFGNTLRYWYIGNQCINTLRHFQMISVEMPRSIYII